ncbi:MAG: hypothetical protein M0002_08145 [Rhodospirillales bacterium]|nr:hypothetical protein [Rhodospirillales bacterium]
MAGAGEMTASLTLRLRDMLSAGIADILEEFRTLNKTLLELTDVTRGLREQLAGLRAPAALAEGLQGIATDATATARAVAGIGEAAVAAGGEVKALSAELATASRVPLAPGVTKGGGKGAAADGGAIGAPGGWGDAMLGAIAAMIGLGAIKQYADFTQPLGHAAITEGLKGAAAIAEIKRLQAALQSLALTTAQSSLELAQAEFFLETTPLKKHPREIAAMLPMMAIAATAYNVPVPDMAQAVFALADVMKVPQAQMMKAFGELAYAAKQAHYNMASFSVALPDLGAAMRLYGATGLEAVTAVAAAMEQVVQFLPNQQAATTGMSELLHYISSPMAGRFFDRTKRSWDMLPFDVKRLIMKYHVPALDIAGFIKKARAEGKDPLNAMVDWLHGLFKNISPKDASDLPFVLGALFHNKEAGAAMTALLLNYKQFEATQKLLTGIGKKTVLTDFATAMKFPEVQVKLFGEEMAQLTRMLGKDLLPLLRGVVAGLRGLLDVLKGAHKLAPGLTETLVQAVAIGGAFKVLRGLLAWLPGMGAKTAGAAVAAGEGTGAADIALGVGGWLAPEVVLPVLGGALVWGMDPFGQNAANDKRWGKGHWHYSLWGFGPAVENYTAAAKHNAAAVEANTKALNDLNAQLGSGGFAPGGSGPVYALGPVLGRK